MNGNGEVLFVRGIKNGSGAEECGSTTEDDVWDDTALVEAYDRAVSLAKEQIIRRMGGGKADSQVVDKSSEKKKKKNMQKKTNNREWHVGAACRAVYSKDGEIYEATIESMQPGTGMCVVRYIGYNNEELVPLKQLQPSGGPAACIRQTEQATHEGNIKENGVKMECNDEYPRESVGSSKSGSFMKSSSNNKEWSVYGNRSGRAGPYPTQFPSVHATSMGLPPMVVPPPPPPHLTSCFPDEDTEALSAMLLSWYMSGFHTGYYQGLQHYKNSQNSSKRNLRKT